jgi:hypothetical protein
MVRLKSKMDKNNKLKTKLVRLFTAYRTYLKNEDLVGAKALSTDEWREILDEALQRRTPPSGEEV